MQQVLLVSKAHKVILGLQDPKAFKVKLERPELLVLQDQQVQQAKLVLQDLLAQLAILVLRDLQAQQELLAIQALLALLVLTQLLPDQLAQLAHKDCKVFKAHKVMLAQLAHKAIKV